MIHNYSFTSKNISKQELINQEELVNFKNYIGKKYSPAQIQNNCLYNYNITENNIELEFIFNQKYGNDIVDFLFEPILIYESNNVTSEVDCNLCPILQHNDLIKLIYNNKVIESMSYSTLLAKIKIAGKQINKIGNKFLIPLEFGILKSGFPVDTNNITELKLRFDLNKSTKNIAFNCYDGFQIIYKCFINDKYKIKNTSQTIKLLNQFFSNPNNKKLLSEINEQKHLSNTNKIQVELQDNDKSIPIYYTSNIIKEQQPVQTIFHDYANKIYNDNNSNGNFNNSYDYNNIQPFNCGNQESDTNKFSIQYGSNRFQNLLDYEFNEQVEEYKKTNESENSMYFQNKKIFNNKVNLITTIGSEISYKISNNKTIIFNSKSFSNLYFYFSNDNSRVQLNLFNGIKLKLNGKTVWESDIELLYTNTICSDFLLYTISYEFNSKTSDGVNNLELTFNNLTIPINLIGLKLIEYSNYMCSYSNGNVNLITL